MLNAVCSRFKNGLGNGSGQVGRNLMDHHKGLLATASVVGFEDMYYYGRRPTNIYIPRFKNVKQQDAPFLRGFHLAGTASRGRQQSVEGIGASLKELLTEPAGWQMGLYGYGECLPYADNLITLNQGKKDKWGQPIITINCEFKDNEKPCITTWAMP